MAEKKTQNNRSRSSGQDGRRGPSGNSRSAGNKRLEKRRAKAYRNRKRTYWLCIAALAGIIILLNVLARISEGFSNWYTRYVYPVWVNTYGRLTSLLPFSLGEWMVVIACILCFVALFLWIPMLICKKNGNAMKFRYVGIRFYRFFLVVCLDVLLVSTLNSYLLYGCSPLDPNPDAKKTEYSVEDIYQLREYIVLSINELAETLPRDENNRLTYDGNMQKEAEKALQKLSKEYPLLDGFVPNVKKMRLFSNLMSQSYICGYFLPFSLEANVNQNMYLTNFPECYCHELSHVRGYIFENEANFLAFRACIGSDDPMFRYSGLLAVYNYVEEDFSRALDANPEFNKDITPLHEYVWEDNVFLTEEAWKEVEEDAILSTETVEQISDTVIDTSLKLNGVESGMISYSEVVKLLLRYYDGILY